MAYRSAPLIAAALLCLALGAPAQAGAQSLPPDIGGRPVAPASGVVERNQSIDSPALGRRLVFNVYRPNREPRADERWPVILLLEGRPSDSDWLDQGAVNEVIDAAVGSGVIPPALVVMPVAPFTWYVDNPDPGGAGLMARALTEDLVRALDERYPTAACRQARAVGGLSMGGYGAMRFGLDRPDLFGAAMSFSGALTPPIARQDTARLARAAGFYDGAFGNPIDRRRYNDGTVFARLRAMSGRPGPKAAMFLAIGDRDRGGLLQSLTRFHVELGRAGYETTLRIAPGAHDWETWRAQFAEALVWLGPRIDPSCGEEVANRARTDDDGAARP